MAEPVTLPLTGTGDATAQVAVDDAGASGVVQIVKLAISADGSAVLLPVDAHGLFGQVIVRTESAQFSVVSATLAAGANSDVNATDITTGKTGRLMAVDVGGTVPFRCDIQTVDGARVTRTTVYSDAGQTNLWRSPASRFFELAGGAGKHFGLSLTNLSPHQAADVRATIYWDEVT